MCQIFDHDYPDRDPMDSRQVYLIGAYFIEDNDSRSLKNLFSLSE